MNHENRRQRLSGAAALSVCALLASAAFAQTAPVTSGDLPVTRLQGGGAAPVEASAPRQVPSVRTGDLSSLPVTHFDDRASTPDLDGPRRLGLSLARPLPLRDMLLLLVNGTAFSIVTDESVDGMFIGDLKDLTMRQALEAVLFPRGLDYDVQGNLIRVAAHKPATRLFDVNLLDQRRTLQRSIHTAGAASTGAGVTADLATTSASDAYDELVNGVKALISDTGRMHVDRGAGLVQVTDFADRLEQVAVYLEALQLRAMRQVRIDVRIFEVTLTDPAATSIDWTAAAARGGASGGISGGRAAGVAVRDRAAFLNAIGEQGSVTMIAAPQVFAMNNQPAVVRAGTESIYFDTASSHDEHGRTLHTSSPAAVLEGLTLTVTPQIAGDGTVQLSVAPSYTEKIGQAKSAGGDPYPQLRVSEADTRVRVQDGDTVVLSGFLRERSRSKPGTGLASYLGSQSHETLKSELVILLTPTVVTPATAASTR